MVKGVNNFSLRGSIRFAFLFSFVSFFIAKSVNAVVYLGQSYSGWGIGGYGWNDVASLYATSGGWFDFAFLFALFYSTALGVFGEKFKENNAGKGIAVALGLILALSLVLYESYMGITLWELAAPLIVLLTLLGTFALVHGAFKKMSFKGWTPPLAAIVATVMMWYAIMSSTGMGQGTFIDFTLGSFDLSEPLLWMLGPVFIFLLIKSLFGVAKHFKGGSSGTGGNNGPNTPRGPRRKFRWPFGRNKQPKTPKTPTTPSGNTSNSAIPLPAGTPGWKNKQVDPDRLRRLNKLVGRIDYLNKDALNLTNQLISYTYYLNEDLKKKEQQVNLNAWGIGTKLHKILKDLGYFKRTLTANHTTLEGLASLANYFRSILLDLNKVVANVEKINQNPYKNYIKNIHRSTAGVWNNLSELNTVVKKIFSASGEYLGKGVKNLTLAQFKKVISDWSGISHEEPPESKPEERPAEEQGQQRALPSPKEEHTKNEVYSHPETKGFAKKIYNEIVLRTHPDKTSNLQLRNIFAWANQAYSEGDYNKLNELKDQMYKIMGNQQKALPAPQDESIESLENLISSSVPIAIPRAKRGIFVKNKKQRTLNVAQFASYVLFGDASKKSSDAYKLREQLTSIIPAAYVQLENWKNLLIKSNYNSKNLKNFDDFMNQYAYLLRFKPKIDKIQNGMSSNRLKGLTAKALTTLSEDPEFNQEYLNMFRQKPTTGEWGVILSDPDKLSFVLEYTRTDAGQITLRKYIDIAYDSLISLDALLNKLKRTVAIVRKEQ